MGVRSRLVVTGKAFITSIFQGFKHLDVERGNGAGV
jgi:hypothetical protein